ncbi:hypothetical protein E0H26_02945 [Micromonospora zingiberis]|uniref:Uncharacterized protein n=1 Tax=Micromonospora zingiberis TaxID=2053011 RepID=A0A4R0GXM1_9ACTN|nr:hypothetical protein [Micromonospora zingiberis]TCC00642.1 hypothetical protein E0H26_02945 [Micromonospora zingiberis]
MTTDEDRESLAERLAALPVPELVDVLRRVLSHHTEEEYGIRTVLVLATATTYAEERGAVDVELVAWPDREYYRGGLGIDQGLWEEGRCTSCDTSVTSNAKRAYCPVCGTRCALT